VIVRGKVVLVWCLAALLLPGCGGQTTPIEQALDSAGALPGWTPSDEVQVYDTENLYDLVDGQADAFFAYAFEEVAVQNYENDEGAGLRVEIWQLVTPADAYGLFTTYRSGTPVTIGREGDGDPGRRLDLWQDRYFVRLFAPQTLPDADLRGLAEAVAGALPADGEPPTLLGRLPQDGLVDRSSIFFHQEISVQSILWLGGQNLLGLSAETDGLLARYDVGEGMAYLLLVQYPNADAAAAGLEALQAGTLSNLVAVQVRGSVLGAVLGTASEVQAGTLLAEALQSE
jgi:hypothetical protein